MAVVVNRQAKEYGSKQSPGQSRKVLLLGQHPSLETLQPGGESGHPIPDLFRTDQPEGRVLGEHLGIAEVFVTSQAIKAEE